MAATDHVGAVRRRRADRRRDRRQGPLRSEVPGLLGRAGNRVRRDPHVPACTGVVALGRPGGQLGQQSDPGPGLDPGPRRLERHEHRVGEPRHRAAGPEDDVGHQVDQELGLRGASGDVDVEELEVLGDRVGGDRVAVMTAGEVQEHPVVGPQQAGDGLDRVGAGLLVVELQGCEGRHPDLAHPAREVPPAVDVGEQLVAADQVVAVTGLQPQLLVLPALGVGGHQPVGVRKSTRVRGRSGVGHPFGHPRGSEPVVEDAARMGHLVEVAGERHGGDRGQVRGVGGGDADLAEPREGDADHADDAVADPRLGCHGLDRVVAVQVGRQVEQVGLSSGAAAAADLHRHRGEACKADEQAADVGLATRRHWVAGQPEEPTQLVEHRIAGCRDLVARVLDHGRERAVGQAQAQGRTDGRRQGDPVAHRDVVEALVHDRRVVERLRRMLVGAQDACRSGVAGGHVEHGVGPALVQSTDGQAAEAVGGSSTDDVGAVTDLDGVAGQRAEHVQLLDAGQHPVPAAVHRRLVADVGQRWSRRAPDQHGHAQRRGDHDTRPAPVTHRPTLPHDLSHAVRHGRAARTAPTGPSRDGRQNVDLRPLTGHPDMCHTASVPHGRGTDRRRRQGWASR